jgi:hypothetical protein
MKFFKEKAQEIIGQSKFLVILDDKTIYEIRKYEADSEIRHRLTGKQNRNYLTPASWVSVQLNELPKDVGIRAKQLNDEALNQQAMPSKPESISAKREAAILAATHTVLGYQVKVKGFNQIGKCYIGLVADPARNHDSTACSWDKLGRCLNRNRADCNLKLD